MKLRDPKVYIPATVSVLVILSLGGTGVYYLTKEKKIKIDVVLDKFINYHEDLINEQDKYDFYIGEYIENRNLPHYLNKKNTYLANLDIRKRGFGSIFFHMNGNENAYESIDFVMFNNDRFSKSEAVSDGGNFEIKSKFKDDDTEISVYLGYLKDADDMTYSEFFSTLPVSDNYIAVFRQTKESFKTMFRKFKEEYTSLQALEAKNDIYVIHNLEDDDVIIDLY